MRKTIYSMLLACVGSLPAYAQTSAPTPKPAGYFDDALRLSRLTSLSGSSRIQAIGGAQTAIGGDISNITGNPAGLGFFNKNAVSIGASLGNASGKGDYFTQQENANGVSISNKFLGNFNHIAGVFVLKPLEEREKGWRGATIGFSVARMNSFQGIFSYKGFNSRHSKLDAYVNNAWNISENQFQNSIDFPSGQSNYLRPAYYGFLLGVPDNPTTDFRYFSYFRGVNEQMIGKIQQDGEVNTKGAQYNWNLAFGGNVSDMLYFGFSAGLSSLSDKRYNTHSEQSQTKNSLLERFNDYDSLQVKGTGINFTAGVIIRPISALRIGASFTAPTSYSMQETTGHTIVSGSYAPIGVFKERKESSKQNEYTYNLRTPMRVNGAIAVFIQKYGFLTFEAEYIPYNTIRLRDYDNGTFFDSDNARIQDTYKAVINYKGGAEFRTEKLYFRAGYAFQDSPIKQESAPKQTISYITGGIGVNMDVHNIDISVVNTSLKSVYTPYSVAFDPNGYGKYLEKNGITAESLGSSPRVEAKRSFLQVTLTYTRKF